MKSVSTAIDMDYKIFFLSPHILCCIFSSFNIKYKVSYKKEIVMMGKIMKQFYALTMIITLVYSYTMNTQKNYAAVEDYNELLGNTIAVYGAKLSDNELEEVKRLLEVDHDAIQEFEVDGQDAAKYINGNPNSNMYSSVKITQKDKG